MAEREIEEAELFEVGQWSKTPGNPRFPASGTNKQEWAKSHFFRVQLIRVQNRCMMMRKHANGLKLCAVSGPREHCLLCGVLIGGVDNFAANEFTIYTWPSSYVHYLQDHWVVPSIEFVHFIQKVGMEMGRNKLPRVDAVAVLTVDKTEIVQEIDQSQENQPISQ